MNENLDLIKILDGCPVGTKFYSTIYGKVDFSRIISDDYGKCPIELMVYNKHTHSIAIGYCEKDGTFSSDYEGGECTLFPSEDQRDWSKFVRFWDIPKIKRFDINTLQPFDKVLVRNTLTTLWKADFYSFSKYPEQDTAKCVGGYWFNCIPYNDDTKHLIGTNDDCPEYYKWWKTKYDEF